MTSGARQEARHDAVWPRDVVSRSVVIVVVAFGLSIIAVAIRSPAWSDPGSVTILVSFGFAILVGEWFRVSAPGFRESAPAATAAAFALAFAVEVPFGHRVEYSTFVVVAVAGVAMVTAKLVSAVACRQLRIVETLGRFVAVVVVALLYRTVHLGQRAGLPAPDDGLEPWQEAVLMIAIAAIGLVADVVFTSLLTPTPDARSRWRRFGDELRSFFGLALALSVTSTLIALAARPLGVIALPLFLVPLMLTQFAFRRYAGIRETYRQSIRTLSRLTDLAGYTPPQHSERVAELSVATGHELGMSGRELVDLEYAALLHDIGQVALVEPIPGGATVLAAPADQHRIERDTVAIVRATGMLDGVAEILEHQNTPYRQVREFGDAIPLASRIIKVANAFEDYRSQADEQPQERALERIYLGLGYEYDPRVVTALQRALERQRAAA